MKEGKTKTRKDLMLYICSWCPEPKQYRSSVDAEWRPITPTIVDILKQGTMAVSHGICEPCSKRVKQELRRDERREAFLKLKEMKRNPRTGELIEGSGL